MSGQTTAPINLAGLRRDVDTAFALTPDGDVRAQLAQALGLLGLKKLRFVGHLTAEAGSDWRLEADLGATVVQACVVTNAPVSTRIDEKILRRYVAEFAEPDGEEAEMPEDDTIEPLPRSLDISGVMAEALALALPLYPRAEGADLGEAVFAAPGVTPMTDEDAKPMAGLAALKDRLQANKDDEESGNEDP